jgi:hypothetical protein
MRKPSLHAVAAPFASPCAAVVRARRPADCGADRAAQSNNLAVNVAYHGLAASSARHCKWARVRAACGKETPMKLLQVLAVLVLGGAALAQADNAAPWAQALAAQALDSGFLSRLPPNLSKAFGLVKPDEGAEVRQLITRSSRQSRTFNVSVANHNDIVIFNVDVHTNDTVAYLLGPDGRLRKALAYRNVDQERTLTPQEAQRGFQSEKRFWSARLKAPAAAPK